MPNLVKRVIKRAFAGPSIAACRVLPATPVIAAMRRLNGIQMSTGEIKLVTGELRRRGPCHFLVFGLGNDSPYWHAANRGGTTVFLEDDEEWLRIVRGRAPNLTAYPVHFGTRLAQWRELLDRPDLLGQEFPKEVPFGRWDVVLVDGPPAWGPEATGRMKSLFAAPRLAAPGGAVFVHDSDREPERAYADRYIGPQRLVAEVDRLRQYRVNPPSGNQP